MAGAGSKSMRRARREAGFLHKPRPRAAALSSARRRCPPHHGDHGGTTATQALELGTRSFTVAGPVGPGCGMQGLRGQGPIAPRGHAMGPRSTWNARVAIGGAETRRSAARPARIGMPAPPARVRVGARRHMGGCFRRRHGLAAEVLTHGASCSARRSFPRSAPHRVRRTWATGRSRAVMGDGASVSPRREAASSEELEQWLRRSPCAHAVTGWWNAPAHVSSLLFDTRPGMDHRRQCWRPPMERIHPQEVRATARIMARDVATGMWRHVKEDGAPRSTWSSVRGPAPLRRLWPKTSHADTRATSPGSYGPRRDLSAPHGRSARGGSDRCPGSTWNALRPPSPHDASARSAVWRHPRSTWNAP